jgi:hypothetical protein
MSSVAKTVNSEAHFPTFWKDEVGAIRLIGPVTHHLLSVARPSLVVNSDANVDLVRELVRLTCLMLLSRLKSRFSLNFLDMPPLQAKFRCAVAQISGNPDHELEGLILWALLTAALLQTKESRKYLLSHILISSLNKGFSSTLVTLEFVKELLWIDSIENEEKATLVEELEQYRRKPSRI